MVEHEKGFEEDMVCGRGVDECVIVTCMHVYKREKN
jgi:hypothetical protein